MAFVVKSKLLDTTIQGIARIRALVSEDVYAVRLKVNGQELAYEVRVSTSYPLGVSDNMAIFVVIKMAHRYVCQYVIHFARGATFDFPIELGDLGAPDRLPIPVDFSWETTPLVTTS